VGTEARFCTSDDGVRIAYCVEGDGPYLVCCPEFVGSFALDDLIDDQMGFWRMLWHDRRVVRYDIRGTGLSQRNVDDVSHDAMVRDLDAVVRASGAQRFTLWASTFSGPWAIAYAVTHPDTVRRLVLYRTFARATDAISPAQAHGFAEFARANWKLAAQTFADTPVRRELPDAGMHQAQMYVQATSGEFVARFLINGFLLTDVTDLLPHLRVPTLVLHRHNDPVFAFRMAQNLAANIPHARLKPLAQAIVSYLAAGRIKEVIDVLNEFIDDGTAATPEGARQGLRTAVQTVLFTDVVGHTEMMQRLGDAKGREVLREHERITRDTLKAHGGAEVKTMGDGFMASFGSVTAAMECAIALQRAFAAYTASMPEPLHVRVGLNAGEPIEEDGDLFGSTVILASRIAQKADAGEILVPDTVRGLLSGKSFLFSDRGEFVPKGFDDAVRLYEVRWREEAETP
jgi:class 3 adenylate cyclase/pimeloyl-ACP methyl ester carboxylesterase